MLCLTLCQLTVAHQAPLSMGFPRQEYWSGLSFPPPGDLSDPGIKPRSLALQADSLPLSHLGSPQRNIYVDMLGGASFSFKEILCIEKKERQSERL